MAIKIFWIIFNGGFEFFANVYRRRAIARYQKVRPADVGLDIGSLTSLFTFNLRYQHSL